MQQTPKVVFNHQKNTVVLKSNIIKFNKDKVKISVRITHDPMDVKKFTVEYFFAPAKY